MDIRKQRKDLELYGVICDKCKAEAEGTASEFVFAGGMNLNWHCPACNYRNTIHILQLNSKMIQA